MKEPDRSPGTLAARERRDTLPVSWVRPAFWVLCALLVPASIAVQVATIRTYIETGGQLLPFQPTGAQGADGYPLVAVPRTLDAGLYRGDTLIRVGEVDTRGLSTAEIYYRTRPYLRAGTSFPVEVERQGLRLELATAPFSHPYWWVSIAVFGSLIVAAAFILHRAPHWHLGRLFFLTAVCWFGHGGSLAPVEPLTRAMSHVVFPSLAIGLTVWLLASWSTAAPPGRWLRLTAVAIGTLYAADTYVLQLSTWPVGLMGSTASAILLSAFLLLTVALLVRAYRAAAPLERRQLRWILYAHFVAIVPLTLVLALRSFVPVDWALVAAFACIAAIPIGYLIAIVGYGWLDIDRVISASAAATVMVVGLVAAMLAVVPAAAGLMSTALAIEPATGQIVLAMLLAAVLVPSYRAVHPRLDRLLFPARHVLVERFEQLRGALGTCRGFEEIATRSGEGFDALLRPESVVIYGRAGETFVPLFVRGRTAPPAFGSDSTLIRVLEGHGRPLFARNREIEPFERAALETLGAEVMVPQLRAGRLVAFTCLGAKRSGDIYTASDLALLDGVTQRCGEVIERIDAETLARDALAIQAALRRYVPSAVAEQLLQGDALAPSEREVTVLFVDLRGYTTLSEQLAAEEVFATLNEHTERVSAILAECGGAVVEFNGDGMMAVFGAPRELARKELHAIDAARQIVDSMPAHLAVGVGVATGTAFVGSIRSTDRLIWSAVGNTTNFAARLQTLTRELHVSIAIDRTTHERAGYVCTDFVPHPALAIRGRSGRFDVFGLPLATG